MIKGVFKVKELIEKLEQFQSDESVAVYEGVVKWIDEDEEFCLTPTCVNKILDWYPPSWVGGKYD